MYKFTPEKEKEIQERAKEIMGQDLKYGELCKALNIKKESGRKNQEKLFLDLSNILVIKTVPFGKQNKYRITNVYEQPLLPYYDKDEWYASFKSIICQMLKDNNNQPMWFTRTPLLNRIGLVNDNFSVVMNSDYRQQLAYIYERTFELDYQACLAISNILSDRVYDTLKKMTQERIIKFIDGYALKAWKDGKKKFITTNELGDDRQIKLYKILFQVENMAIDSICPFATKNNDKFINRNAIKQIHFQQFIKQRNFFIQSKAISDKIKALGFEFDKIEEFYDVKFILSDDRLVDQVLLSQFRTRKLINLAAQNKIKDSKSKTLTSYKAFLPGIIENYISIDTEIDYKSTLTK